MCHDPNVGMVMCSFVSVVSRGPVYFPIASQMLVVFSLDFFCRRFRVIISCCCRFVELEFSLKGAESIHGALTRPNLHNPHQFQRSFQRQYTMPAILSPEISSYAYSGATPRRGGAAGGHAHHRHARGGVRGGVRGATRLHIKWRGGGGGERVDGARDGAGHVGKPPQRRWAGCGGHRNDHRRRIVRRNAGVQHPSLRTMTRICGAHEGHSTRALHRV